MHTTCGMCRRRNLCTPCYTVFQGVGEFFFVSRIYNIPIEGYEHIHAAYFWMEQHHFCANGKSLVGEYD